MNFFATYEVSFQFLRYYSKYNMTHYLWYNLRCPHFQTVGKHYSTVKCNCISCSTFYLRDSDLPTESLINWCQLLKKSSLWRCIFPNTGHVQSLSLKYHLKLSCQWKISKNTIIIISRDYMYKSFTLQHLYRVYVFLENNITKSKVASSFLKS